MWTINIEQLFAEELPLVKDYDNSNNPIPLLCSLQALKRLMTFCQKKFEADPSKSVEYRAV